MLPNVTTTKKKVNWQARRRNFLSSPTPIPTDNEVQLNQPKPTAYSSPTHQYSLHFVDNVPGRRCAVNAHCGTFVALSRASRSLAAHRRQSPPTTRLPPRRSSSTTTSLSVSGEGPSGPLLSGLQADTVISIQQRILLPHPAGVSRPDAVPHGNEQTKTFPPTAGAP
jgi:hypothetical protein